MRFISHLPESAFVGSLRQIEGRRGWPRAARLGTERTPVPANPSSRDQEFLKTDEYFRSDHISGNMFRVMPSRQFPGPGETATVRSVSWLRTVAVLILALGCLQHSSARLQELGPAPASIGADEPITAISSLPKIEPLKVRLGERLFDDSRLSHDNSRSCSTC